MEDRDARIHRLEDKYKYKSSGSGRGHVAWKKMMQKYKDKKALHVMHGNLATSTVAEFHGRLRCKNTKTGRQKQIHIKKRFGSGRGGIAWRVERVILYFLSETCMGGAAAIARLKQKSGKQIQIPMNKDKYNH